MKLIDNLNHSIKVLDDEIVNTTHGILKLAVENPDIASFSAAVTIAAGVTGLSLKTLEPQKEFVLNKIVRGIGFSTYYGTLATLSVAAAGLIYTCTGKLISNYEHYSELYSRVYLALADSALNGAIEGGIVGLIAYTISRTFICRGINALEGRLTWEKINPSEVPTEKDILRLKPLKVSQKKLKNWLKLAQSKNEVLLGVDQQTKKPLFISLKEALADCWQTSGMPGSGKGVFNQLLFNQFIGFGHVNVVFNPKADEYARASLHNACIEAKLPFYRVDLTQPIPSFNVLEGCSQEQIFEIFCSAFGFENTAQESSYYSAVSRRIIREVTEQYTPTSIAEFLEIAKPVMSAAGKDSENLKNRLIELSLVKATQTKSAAPLFEVFEKGGCILFEGTPFNDSILTLMKMIHCRVIQLAMNRRSEQPPVNIWLDEVRFNLNTNVLAGLSTSRSFNYRYFISTQSNADFELVQLPYRPEATRRVVNEDSPIRVFYTTQDHESAVDISKHCRSTNSSISVNTTSVNELGTETSNSERHISHADQPLFHPNIIKGLPKSMAIIAYPLTWPKMITIPTLICEKTSIPFHEAQLIDLTEAQPSKGDDLL